MNHDLSLNGGGGEEEITDDTTVISFQFFTAHNGKHGVIICMPPIFTP